MDTLESSSFIMILWSFAFTLPTWTGTAPHTGGDAEHSVYMPVMLINLNSKETINSTCTHDHSVL